MRLMLDGKTESTKNLDKLELINLFTREHDMHDEHDLIPMDEMFFWFLSQIMSWQYSLLCRFAVHTRQLNALLLPLTLQAHYERVSWAAGHYVPVSSAPSASAHCARPVSVPTLGCYIKPAFMTHLHHQSCVDQEIVDNIQNARVWWLDALLVCQPVHSFLCVFNFSNFVG